MRAGTIRNGASERISWLGLDRSDGSVVSRQQNNRNRFAALAWDPAHSPDLLLELEARLADGHSSSEQTKTLHQRVSAFVHP
ncbi:hypothetical protein SynMEDNS5_00445 [Synechococcus sp. MEDNS5]|nr:hypothetical protein SynMEDNS5_00445 [Synechococcus sp. MEDNS5]